MPGNQSATVAIIGGGFGGIAAAVKLLKAGIGDFTVFERSPGPGGTWWDNRYPGCEVDIPSHAYSFSFAPRDWPRTHATQPELRDYAESVIDQYGLRDRFRFGVGVESVTWDEAAGSYLVRTSDGEERPYRFVISAVGLLSVPRYPDWPGLDEFEGVSFHTSRWDEEADLTGKRVAIVGTGSTAVQIVPAIAPDAGRLQVFQREPGWVEPKGERAFTPAERARFRRFPALRRLYRLMLFFRSGRRFKAYDLGGRDQGRMRELCLRYIAGAIHDPVVRDAVTPSYPWGCKRPIYASGFYPALNRDNVELVPQAIKEVTPKGVVDARGVEHEADVLILSTGFQPTRFLSQFTLTGRHGTDIQDFWGDRPRAFLGATVPGFPNFFILYGPNTNGGFSIIAQLERQAEVAVRAIRKVLRTGATLVDTRPAALERHVRWLDSQLDKHASAMNSGCNNYYHSSSGANVTQWPRTHFVYYLLCRTLPRSALIYR
ncbi:alpha/beta hydrolase fold-3 domain-containing protein [Acrocarpospora phusangensis]|uniref:Alpha/beta hydrolase fold-3 domain-containing protein n=1 Tax=Acrocarpospora phusangensis TaxID=1070424 RepID=A0A919Q889_9ACTN|nr:NAD(P)/FAD-dependent oxidoreductase [Acrocarpospora phusangensis]GIH24142.1 alpha/beta hydrolase fold-3 domain-containing protein [Acrocarpospora phusangensis]